MEYLNGCNGDTTDVRVISLYTNQGIAKALGLSVKTIEFHTIKMAGLQLISSDRRRLHDGSRAKKVCWITKKGRNALLDYSGGRGRVIEERCPICLGTIKTSHDVRYSPSMGYFVHESCRKLADRKQTGDDDVREE